MSIATSQQIARYYETFRNINVTFSKEIVKTTGLQSQYVFLKCLGEQWPCIVYSSSFTEMKILAPSRQTLMERITKANNLVNVRLGFGLPDTDPLLFFVSGKVSGYSPYAQSNGSLQVVSITFTQRPPDDFVEIVGRVLEANINAKRRREERILLTPDVMRKIGLPHKESTIIIDKVPRRCILRDLSFSGAKVIIVGIAKFLVGKVCSLRIDLEDPRESVIIPGQIVRYEDVEGRKDLTAIAIQYNEVNIPLTYKIHINDYLGQKRASTQDDDNSQDKNSQSTKSSTAPQNTNKASEQTNAEPQKNDAEQNNKIDVDNF